MVDETASTSSSLSEEQLAFYRARIESGFYRSSGVVKEIAERLTDALADHDKE